MAAVILIGSWCAMPRLVARESGSQVDVGPLGSRGWAMSDAQAPSLHLETDGAIVYHRDRKEDFSAYCWQRLQLVRGLYRLEVRYAAEGGLAPTMAFYVLDAAGRPAGISRIIRLSSQPTDGLFECEILTDSTEIGAPVEVRIYPGTRDENRMSDTAPSYLPAGQFPGTVRFSTIDLRLLEPKSINDPRGPFAVNTEEVTFHGDEGRSLRMLLDRPVGVSLTGKPVFMWIHGGGWVQGKPEDIRGYSYFLASHGFACLRPQYRLLGEGGDIKHAADDLLAALDWARNSPDRFGGGRLRFVLGGSSAGAHLAALVAQSLDDCIGLICFSGLYDIVQKGEGVFGRNAGFLGGSSSVEWKRASPLYQLRQPPVPALLFHGEQDAAIDRRQAVRFARAIVSKGGRAEAIICPSMAHSISLSQEVQEKIEAFVHSLPSEPGSKP